jgi:methionyl-tRNA formyltransferase
MKVILFGEDSFSGIVLESLIKAEHVILGVFCPIYDNKVYIKLSKICEKNNIPFERLKSLDFSSSIFINKITSLQPDIGVICHFQTLIKKELINIPKYGFINLHPSLLPKYRGMSPQHWPIINGDNETGITIHFVDENTDTGDIILQTKITINNNEYVSDLQNKMKSSYFTIVIEAIDIILENNKTKYIKQSHLKESYYGKLKESDCNININGSYINAYNLIKGVSFPYLGAKLNNITIWKANPVDIKDFINFQNGIVVLENGEKFIKFKDGVLRIIK